MDDNSWKILAIDDNPDNLITLEAVLADAFPTASVSTALDGQQGLAMAKSDDPDVILLDILMPNMDGYEVCRRLKADEHTRMIPVVFLTAMKSSIRDNRLRALQVGADGFLNKPIDEAELSVQIQAMVKIKQMNVLQMEEKQHLNMLVEERTAALEHELNQHRLAEQELRKAQQRLEQSQTATLNLLEDLKAEIDARKRSEAELRESEEKFALAFNNSPYVITITDPDTGRFIEVNQSYYQLFGYSSEETMQSSVIELKLWGDPADRVAMVQDLYEGKVVSNREYQFRTKGGNIITALFSGDFLNLNGKQYILSSVEDITERKKVEQSLIESEEKFSLAFRNSPYGIVFTKAEDGTIVDANPAFTIMTGYSHDEILKKPSIIGDLWMGSPDRYKVREDALSGAPVQNQEYPFRRKDGRIMIGSISSVSIVMQQRKYLVTIVADVTAQKEARELILRQAHIQERLVAMGRTLSSIIDVDMIYRIAYRYVKEILDVPCFGITLYDSVEKQIYPVYVVADNQVINVSSVPPLPYTPEDPYADRSGVIATQSPLIIHENLFEHSAGCNGILVGDQDAVPQSAIYVPMIAEGKSIGVLDLQSYDKNAFTAETSEWLGVVANQVALAIQNARLYEQVRKRVAQLGGLREIDTAINAHQPLNMIFDMVLSQVRYHLEVDAADILLLDASRDQLIYRGGFGFLSDQSSQMQFSFGCGLPGMVAANGKTIQHHGSDEYAAILAQCPKWNQEQFQMYVGVPVKIGSSVSGVLEVFHRRKWSPDPERLQYMETLAGQAAIAIENSNLIGNLEQTAEELLQAYDATIEGWSKAMDLRDRETEGHTQRVTELTLKLAHAVGIPESEVIHIHRGGLLHDIGKLGVPDSILLKPGPLDAKEWKLMKQHPQMAYDMLKSVDYLIPALDIPHYHHEKWDGSGYPEGLRGEEIPLSARMFALSDVWDAVTNDRPYHSAWTRDEAKAHLRKLSGIQFDPSLVELFISIVDGEE